MSERRMFAKTIVTSDAFLDMPPTARCLYFTLAMFADDDGFVNNPKSIMRQVGSTTDDMNILITKKFVLVFESGVIVIKHWRIHNYIRGDRKHETKYAEEMAMLTTDDNGAYTLTDRTEQLPLEDADSKSLRQKAYAESELPYSFDYKIKRAFWNTECPVCGKKMTSAYLCQPTIQHNKPISKGGKHELGNISVICQSCNSSIRDKETSSLNAEQVIEAWEKICQSNVSQLTDNCHTEVRLGKDSIGKDRIDKSIVQEEFDKLWSLYPKKQGKQSAYKAYEKARKDGVTYEEVEQGIKAYAEYVKGKDAQYIKMGSSFFNQRAWQDDWSIRNGYTRTDEYDNGANADTEPIGWENIFGRG